MLKLKTKWFNKWAKKNSISNTELIKTLIDLENNLNAVSLGSGLFKVRTKKSGSGKSGGYRTLIAYKINDKAIFLYAFSKNEKDNLDSKELHSLKKLSNDLLNITNEEYVRQIKLGNFFSLEE